MRRTARVSMGAMALSLVVATSVMAAPAKIYIHDIDPWNQGNGGGPFEVTPIDFTNVPEGLGANGANPGNFFTFCIETNEFLSQGGTYFVEFSNAAKNGGVGGGNPDPLDDRTRYLYTHFIRGTLQAQLTAWDAHVGPTHTFNYGQAADGVALQRAIWHIEQENSGSNNFLVALAEWALGVGTGNGADTDGMNKVKVMNMWANYDPQTGVYSGARQDLLVMIPLPAPVWMGGVGLLGVVGFVYRRRRSGSAAEPVALND